MSWARTDMAGDADEEILQRAQEQERVVVTFDKDFGDLAFHWGLPASCGVLLFRLRIQTPEYVRDRVLETLAGHPDCEGNFSVIEEHRIRVRPLPSSSSQSTEEE